MSIPNDIRIPLVYIEIDNSNAIDGTPINAHNILVIGQALPSGEATPLRAVQITNDNQASVAFGRGSMLAAQLSALRKTNSTTPLWAMAVPELTEGAKACSITTLTGTASSAGTWSLMIAGLAVQVGIAAQSSANDVVARAVDIINANQDLPVIASVGDDTPAALVLTCKWNGLTGNDLDVRSNYYTGQQLPAGLSVTHEAFSGGAGAVDMVALVASMPATWFNHLVMPFNDKASLMALREEMDRRWGPLLMQEGIVYGAYRGTLAQTGAFGESLNAPLFTMMGTNLSPTPPWAWAASYAGTGARELAIDPARPLQTLVLKGMLPPTREHAWDFNERNLLLFDGIATYCETASGECAIEREISTYRVNSFGDPDPSYLDITTPATLGYLRYAMRTRITQRYPRHKLANDDVLANLTPGQAVVTPKLIRECLLDLASSWVSKGLIESFDTFKSTLSVTRDKDNHNRINVVCSPDIINQLRMFAATLQFKL